MNKVQAKYLGRKTQRVTVNRVPTNIFVHPFKYYGVYVPGADDVESINDPFEISQYALDTMGLGDLPKYFNKKLSFDKKYKEDVIHIDDFNAMYKALREHNREFKKTNFTVKCHDAYFDMRLIYEVLNPISSKYVTIYSNDDSKTQGIIVLTENGIAKIMPVNYKKYVYWDLIHPSTTPNNANEQAE